MLSRKNSRLMDLERLDQARYESGNRKKATERVNLVYKQANDETLEEGRRLLIEAHKRRDVALANKIEDEIREYAIKRGYIRR